MGASDMPRERQQEPEMVGTTRALSCPFCGAQPTEQPWHGGGPRKTMIACDCVVGPQVTGSNRTRALDRWNTRGSVLWQRQYSELDRVRSRLEQAERDLARERVKVERAESALAAINHYRNQWTPRRMAEIARDYFVPLASEPASAGEGEGT